MLQHVWDMSEGCGTTLGHCRGQNPNQCIWGPELVYLENQIGVMVQPPTLAGSATIADP